MSSCGISRCDQAELREYTPGRGPLLAPATWADRSLRRLAARCATSRPPRRFRPVALPYRPGCQPGSRGHQPAGSILFPCPLSRPYGLSVSEAFVILISSWWVCQTTSAMRSEGASRWDGTLWPRCAASHQRRHSGLALLIDAIESALSSVLSWLCQHPLLILSLAGGFARQREERDGEAGG